jgi:hypothetical protein
LAAIGGSEMEQTVTDSRDHGQVTVVFSRISHLFKTGLVLVL